MKRWISYHIFAALFFMMASCATGSSLLKTEPVEEEGIAGTFRVIMFGCGYLDDPETIAFLDREDDRIFFEPHAPDFKFRVFTGVPAAEAVKRARQFVECSSSFLRSQVAGILNDAGRVMGYEVRPLYLPLTYGVDDIIWVDYRLRAERVVIDIRPIPSVEHLLSGGDGDRDN